MKKIGLITLALIMAVGSYAQKGVEDGSRYGQGQDSIECLKNISIYTGYIKTENYKDAYENGWKAVFNDSPLAQNATYTNGVKILRALYKDETDAAKKEQYSNELMQVYEQRIKYLDKLNALAKNPTREGEILAQYAHDYISYNPKPALEKAYDLLRKAVTMEKEKVTYYVLSDLMKVSSQRYKSKPNDDAVRDALLQDYLDCSTYIDPVIEAQTSENVKEAAKKTKENIDAYFVNSGAADCDNLQAIYGPKVEDNKNDLEYLTKVVNLMSMLDCKSSDAYFSAAEYAHAISPSVKTAKSLASLYISKREDYDKAIEFYDQAIELETDKESLSDLYYKEAQIYSVKKNDDRSRAAVQKAISANPNNGNAYILLAQLYASHHSWSNEPALNRCAYFAVIDKLEQAKRVDASVADRANDLLREYRKQTENMAEDLFMLGIKPGDKVEIKGWINETVTIR